MGLSSVGMATTIPRQAPRWPVTFASCAGSAPGTIGRLCRNSAQFPRTSSCSRRFAAAPDSTLHAR